MNVYFPVLSNNVSLNPEFFFLLTESHAKLVGTPLVPEGRSAAWLYYDAPFAVLAQGTGPDPLFIYANKTAQACFEYSWEEFVRLPSRLSAEVPNRAERQRLLDEVARTGCVRNYRGTRISKSGRRFEIQDGIVWNLVDPSGMKHGQAARFSFWHGL